jgi:hypothetical protein
VRKPPLLRPSISYFAIKTKNFNVSFVLTVSRRSFMILLIRLNLLTGEFRYSVPFWAPKMDQVRGKEHLLFILCSQHPLPLSQKIPTEAVNTPTVGGQLPCFQIGQNYKASTCSSPFPPRHPNINILGPKQSPNPLSRACQPSHLSPGQKLNVRNFAF